MYMFDIRPAYAIADDENEIYTIYDVMIVKNTDTMSPNAVIFAMRPETMNIIASLMITEQMMFLLEMMLNEHTSEYRFSLFHVTTIPNSDTSAERTPMAIIAAYGIDEYRTENGIAANRTKLSIIPIIGTHCQVLHPLCNAKGFKVPSSSACV